MGVREIGTSGAWRRAPLLATLVLLLGMACVVPGVLVARASEHEAVERRLDRPVAGASAALTAEVRRYEDAVRQAAVALSAPQAVTQARFLQLTAPLATAQLPGAAGVSYVTESGVADVVTYARALD